MYELHHLCLPEASPKKKHLSFRMRLDEFRGDLGRSLRGVWRIHGTISYDPALFLCAKQERRLVDCCGRPSLTPVVNFLSDWELEP